MGVPLALAVPPPIAAGGSCARSNIAAGADAGSPSAPWPSERVLRRPSRASHSAMAPSRPQLAKIVPAALRLNGDGFDTSAMPAERSMRHHRLHVPQTHGLVPARGEHAGVPATPRHIEDGVIVRDPLRLRAEVVLGARGSGEAARRVRQRHRSLLVRHRQERAPARLLAESDDEGR